MILIYNSKLYKQIIIYKKNKYFLIILFNNNNNSYLYNLLIIYIQLVLPFK